MDDTLSARLRDLETVLCWEGEIDNQRIRELLDVKTVWASRLLGELSKKMDGKASRPTPYAPLKMTWYEGKRRKPELPNSLDTYLMFATASKQGGTQEIVEDSRIDLGVVRPEVFSAAHQAAKRGDGLLIVYRSMSKPEGSSRVVFPHALIRAPRRWHMRAWCTERKDFRDFALGRIQTIEAVDSPAPFSAEDDKKWTTMVTLKIAPHPSLTEAQQDLISAEYFAGANSLKVSVRQCLASYIIQDLRVAIDPDRQHPPEYQLLLSNAKALPEGFATSGR